MQSVLYFAYGSNMLAERLKRRCPSALVQGVAIADDHQLAFSKIGQDGSGKATLVPATGQRTCGVLFNIAVDELLILDRIEGRGRGYERHEEFALRSAADDSPIVGACSYLSTPPYMDESLRPFDWYLELVAAGARQNRLPAAHVATIGRTEFQFDPDPARPQRLEALEVLRLASQAGIRDGG